MRMRRYSVVSSGVSAADLESVVNAASTVSDCDEARGARAAPADPTRISDSSARLSQRVVEQDVQVVECVLVQEVRLVEEKYRMHALGRAICSTWRLSA